MTKNKRRVRKTQHPGPGTQSRAWHHAYNGVPTVRASRTGTSRNPRAAFFDDAPPPPRDRIPPPAVCEPGLPGSRPAPARWYRKNTARPPDPHGRVDSWRRGAPGGPSVATLARTGQSLLQWTMCCTVQGHFRTNGDPGPVSPGGTTDNTPRGREAPSTTRCIETGFMFASIRYSKVGKHPAPPGALRPRIRS